YWIVAWWTASVSAAYVMWKRPGELPFAAKLAQMLYRRSDRMNDDCRDRSRDDQQCNRGLDGRPTAADSQQPRLVFDPFRGECGRRRPPAGRHGRTGAAGYPS